MTCLGARAPPPPGLLEAPIVPCFCSAVNSGHTTWKLTKVAPGERQELPWSKVFSSACHNIAMAGGRTEGGDWAVKSSRCHFTAVIS